MLSFKRFLSVALSAAVVGIFATDAHAQFVSGVGRAKAQCKIRRSGSVSQLKCNHALGGIQNVSNVGFSDVRTVLVLSTAPVGSEGGVTGFTVSSSRKIRSLAPGAVARNIKGSGKASIRSQLLYPTILAVNGANQIIGRLISQQGGRVFDTIASADTESTYTELN